MTVPTTRPASGPKSPGFGRRVLCSSSWSGIGERGNARARERGGRRWTISLSADRTFVDTNVLTYLFDDAERCEAAGRYRRLETEQQARELVLSTQVLQELYVSLTKGKSPIATSEIAEAAVQHAAGGYTIIQVDAPLVLSAIAVCRRDRVSFWDALILRAASVAGCDRLLSEDLNPGQTIDGVTIENPFV